MTLFMWKNQLVDLYVYVGRTLFRCLSNSLPDYIRNLTLFLFVFRRYLKRCRSFQYASPCFWNQLPASLRQPRTNLSNSDSPSPMSGTSSIGSIHSPLSSPRSFIPGLKPSFSENPSHCSLPRLLQDWLHGFSGLFTNTTKLIRFYFFFFSTVLAFGSVR